MKLNRPRILVITPVKHIDGVPGTLESTGQVTYLDDPTEAEVLGVIGEYELFILTQTGLRFLLAVRSLMQPKILRSSVQPQQEPTTLTNLMLRKEICPFLH